MGKFERNGRVDGTMVSVIVPVYNVAPYIEDCVESIQSQTYSDLEIILVDDGSTDGSGEICDRLAAGDSRIKVIHQKNAGVAASRGAGIEASSGKYIGFVDGDDWIEPDMMADMLGRMGDADLVTSGIFKQSSPDMVEKRRDSFPEGRYEGERLAGLLETMIYDKDADPPNRLIPSCCTKIFRGSLAEQVYAGMDTGMAHAEDAVFVYKYMLRCRSVVVCHACFYHYRYREESAVHSVNPRMLSDINKVYLALEDDFRQHRLGERLLLQTQKWISFLCCMAVNKHMGFDSRAGILQFIADLSYLEGKRLVLYGAGRMGKDTHAQLRQFGYDVVLWVDKDYRFHRGQGLPVTAPEEIAHTEYDQILIAVGGEALAGQIRTELIKMGYPETRITWRRPIRIY